MAKYYVTAGMFENLGACFMAREIIGHRRVPLTKATVKKVLQNEDDADFLYWPAARLRDNLAESGFSFDAHERAGEIAQRLGVIGAAAVDSTHGCDCADCKPVTLFRENEWRNGVPSDSVIAETLSLLNEVGDLWHAHMLKETPSDA